MLESQFAGLVPARPYCANRLEDGLRIYGREHALRFRHLQYNEPHLFRWMVHDLDWRGSYYAHVDNDLPPPNVIVINRDNGHAHCAYLMAVPVARHASGRLAPLRFYAAVERGVARRLNADRQYAGLIAKNPLHRHWCVEWRRNEAYSLEELRSWLSPEDMAPEPVYETAFGAGRNVTVFDELRRVGYAEVRSFKRNGASIAAFHTRLEQVAASINRQFPIPLPLSELRAIAKSVSKWTWRHFSPEHFSQIQRHRAGSNTRRHLRIVEEIKANASARSDTKTDHSCGVGGAAGPIDTNGAAGLGRTAS